MAILVIGGGSSVNRFPKGQLTRLAEDCFTFTVNNSCFDFPCDVVVATDFQWVLDNKLKLKELGKPIVTREWAVLSTTHLDYIILPNEITLFCRLSGMCAAKLADSMAGGTNAISYVIGLDGTKGHYYNSDGDAGALVGPSDYAALMTLSTVNLGGSNSKIECWPREERLPNVDKIGSKERRCYMTMLRTLAKHLIRENM